MTPNNMERLTEMPSKPDSDRRLNALNNHRIKCVFNLVSILKNIKWDQGWSLGSQPCFIDILNLPLSLESGRVTKLHHFTRPRFNPSCNEHHPTYGRDPWRPLQSDRLTHQLRLRQSTDPVQVHLSLDGHLQALGLMFDQYELRALAHLVPEITRRYPSPRQFGPMFSLSSPNPPDPFGWSAQVLLLDPSAYVIRS
jgi:hypothetical protein